MSSDVVEIIRDQPPEIVEVFQNPQPTLIQVVAAGPQGPQGPSGSSDIGGYGVSISDAINGDVLGFNGTVWYNRRQETLTDGGNF